MAQLPAAGWRRDAAELPAWLRETAGEQRIPVLAALVVAMAFQALLPVKFLLVPWWAVVIPEALLLGVTVAGNPLRLSRESAHLRRASLLLTALITVANGASACLLVRDLVDTHGQRVTNTAATLLVSGASIYATNIVAFGLWYWEFDRGGPFARMHGSNPYPDLLFPQQSVPGVAAADWEPRFFDYLYVSFTNATAFSPTDTMPLSRWAKLLMMVQSAVALVTVGLVVARAVNVLQ
ncbi:MAG: hypothetical protein ACRDTP_08815 [Mycobacteriales bacterium]